MPSIDNDGCNINVFRFSILNADFTLNASVHAVTRRYHDIHITKVNLEVAKRSFYFIGAMEFNSLPCLKCKESFIEFSKEAKYFLVN